MGTSAVWPCLGSTDCCFRVSPPEGRRHCHVRSAAVTMRQATASIPIVFAPAVDPVGIGLVANLSRPGGNATGMSSSFARNRSRAWQVGNSV